MGELDVIADDPGTDRRIRDRAWILLVGLLVGTFAFGGLSGGGTAGASRSGACPDGSSPSSVTLPSGETKDFCYGDGAATNAVDPVITLAKTVGTDDAACATENAITVSAGTEVFYCYTVSNTGEVTVSVHDLEDDHLGQLLSGFPYELGPGASTFLTASATIDETTTNVATWSASDGVVTASATDTALVTVEAAAEPPAEPPGAPSITGVAVSEGRATITWDAPADPGTSAITGYTLTPYVGATAGTPITVGASARTATLDALVNGSAQTIQIVATNDAGDGPAATSDEFTPQWWMPWSSGPVAVNEIVTWMTGVAPTEAQRNAWLDQLDAGTIRPGDLVAEIRGGTDATTNVDPTVRLYSAYLTRIPDAGGLNFWLGRRRGGWTLSRISSNFAASSEFKRRYGTLTNRQFVEQIYLNVLGRTGEASGVDYWTRQLDTKKKSRGQVMINFSESNEYKTKQVGPVHAAVLYIHLVGRAPTTGERTAVISSLLSGDTVAEIARELIHEPSFDARAG